MNTIPYLKSPTSNKKNDPTGYGKKANTSLLKLIIVDFLYTQKIALILLVFIIATANVILKTTQKIREQLIEREQLLLNHGVLESEWRNLVIEENVLADPKRVEYLAKKKLKMDYVTPENETVIIIKSN